jgi:hypothetical protein
MPPVGTDSFPVGVGLCTPTSRRAPTPLATAGEETTSNPVVWLDTNVLVAALSAKRLIAEPM